jgi:hypothetical protein
LCEKALREEGQEEGKMKRGDKKWRRKEINGKKKSRLKR